VSTIRRLAADAGGLLVLGLFLYLISAGIETMQQNDWLNSWELSGLPPSLQNGITLFLSIFIEGIPFILLGVLVSSLIHVWLKEETVWQVIPKTPWMGIPAALMMGMFLPVCECGIVPVARRLMGKRVPPYLAVTFLLAVPIINPVTILSTYLAFGNSWEMVGSRIGLAALIASVMGLLCYFLFPRRKDVLKAKHFSSCNHHHDHEHTSPDSFAHRSHHALQHAVFEFMDMGKFFVFGALIAAGFQTLVGIRVIEGWANNPLLSVFLMMGLAFGLSICSSADAFVAAAFRNGIGTAGLMAFLVFGPMMDIKNLMMMWGSFRWQVVLFFFGGTALLTVLSVMIYF
jgi:uncharacterized protein